MKLCHIVPSLEERHGGPSKSVRNLCVALADSGHTVELLTTAPDAPAEGGDERRGNLRIRTFRRSWPETITRSPSLARVLTSLDADVFHHHALWLRTLNYAARRASRGQAPLVISPRGMMSPWAWRHHRWRKRAASALVHPGAFEVAAGWHATSAAESMDIEALGFTQPRCVAPNGVDAPTPTDVQAAADYWRAACPEVTRRPTALFYGRFHQKKRVVELIDVWLQSAPQDWLLLLVGLPQEYTPESLEQYIHQHSASGRIRVFSGAKRPAPYPIASLFLLASHSENFGLTVAEAMAHGVPVLVTDSTPWQGVNQHDCGWCVSWADFGNTIAAATRHDRDSLANRGARARNWVLSEFSWSRAAAELTAFYHTLRTGTGERT